MKVFRKNTESEYTAKYFYCDDSVDEYLFCVLCGKLKITVYFRDKILNYLFLHSQPSNAAYIILENGIVGMKFSHDIRCLFRGENLVFQIHSLDLFDESVDLTFYRRGKINCGIAGKSYLSGLGISITSEKIAENSFFNKLGNLPFFHSVDFLVCGNENNFCAMKKTIVKKDYLRDCLELKNRAFEANMRSVMAFYLNCPQQSVIRLSGNALKNNKNIFLVFLFASYVFNEDDLYHKLFSFYADTFRSVLQMRKRLNFFIEALAENKNVLTDRNFYSESEEFGFFIGSKSFLFFRQKKFCGNKKLHSDFFLLKEKCFASNMRKYNISAGRDWGIALFPGACVPIENERKFHLMIFPDMENKISFKHGKAKISAVMTENEINIVYDFPLLEKITVIISPFRVNKIYKNGEYAPLIVAKNCDCVEISTGVTTGRGNITIHIG